MFGELVEHIERHTYIHENLDPIIEDIGWKQATVRLYQMLCDLIGCEGSSKETTEASEKFLQSIQRLQASRNVILHGKKITENLTGHAKRELRIAGLFDKDSDYEGMLGEAMMELMDVFAKQGHSGCSAAMCRELFHKLANYEPLTEITNDPEEWMAIPDGMGGEGMTHQCRRNPALLSGDGGKTYWNVDDDFFIKEDEDGTRWNSSEDWENRPIYTSKKKEELITASED